MGWRDNLHLISGDLSNKKLVDILKENESWDKTVQTLILAEGLLMYLPSESVNDLFCQCNEVTGVGSRIVFTYVSKSADGRPDVGRWTGLVLWMLKVNGEPWIWSIQPEDLSRFLEETGWIYAPDLSGVRTATW